MNKRARGSSAVPDRDAILSSMRADTTAHFLSIRPMSSNDVRYVHVKQDRRTSKVGSLGHQAFRCEGAATPPGSYFCELSGSC